MTFILNLSTSDLAHTDNCPVGMARAALAKARGEAA